MATLKLKVTLEYDDELGGYEKFYEIRNVKISGKNCLTIDGNFTLRLYRVKANPNEAPSTVMDANAEIFRKLVNGEF